MSPSNDLDADFIAEALPAFLSEAEEQVEALEALLLRLEDQPDDTELLNALFRCAHTVKGSAGIFGLDAVVAFTHHVETLLQRLREGQLHLTPELSTLLLRCNDQVRILVAEAGGQPADDAAATQRAALVLALQAATGVAPGDEAAPAREAATPAAGTSRRPSAPRCSATAWTRWPC
jgi:two-component system chemotaxis sensor kinase CheA